MSVNKVLFGDRNKRHQKLVEFKRKLDNGRNNLVFKCVVINYWKFSVLFVSFSSRYSPVEDM